jgi:hypothetical protein
MGYPFPEKEIPTFEDFKKLPIICLPVKDLTPSQYVVRIDRMQWLAAGNQPEGNDVPHCVEWLGVTYLYDGHHRWLLAQIHGVTQLAVRCFRFGWKVNPEWIELADKPHLTVCFHPDAFAPLPPKDESSI